MVGNDRVRCASCPWDEVDVPRHHAKTAEPLSANCCGRAGHVGSVPRNCWLIGDCRAHAPYGSLSSSGETGERGSQSRTTANAAMQQSVPARVAEIGSRLQSEIVRGRPAIVATYCGRVGMMRHSGMDWPKLHAAAHNADARLVRELPKPYRVPIAGLHKTNRTFSRDLCNRPTDFGQCPGGPRAGERN